MRKKWASWNLGGKIIFFSVCAGLLSLFLPWLVDPLDSRHWYDMPVGSASMLLLLFGGPFGYPVSALWTARTLHKGWGVACAALGFLLGGWVIHGITFPPGIYQPGSGAGLYIVSTLALAAGVLFYRLRPVAT